MYDEAKKMNNQLNGVEVEYNQRKSEVEIDNSPELVKLHRKIEVVTSIIADNLSHLTDVNDTLFGSVPAPSECAKEESNNFGALAQINNHIDHLIGLAEMITPQMKRLRKLV